MYSIIMSFLSNNGASYITNRQLQNSHYTPRKTIQHMVLICHSKDLILPADWYTTKCCAKLHSFVRKKGVYELASSALRPLCEHHTTV